MGTGRISVTNASLLNFVASLYNPDGTPAMAFAVFRVNADIPLPPNNPPRRGYLVAMADYPDPAFRPELDLTTTAVPEPSTLAMASILSCMFGAVWSWKRAKLAGEPV